MIFLIVFLGYLPPEVVSMRKEEYEQRIKEAIVIQNMIEEKKSDPLYIEQGLKEQIEMSLGKGFQLLKHPLPESLQHLQC